MSDWSPAQYGRFKQQRSEPFFDLLSLVKKQPAMRVLDLGCGTGELTAVLKERLAAAQVLGIDNSATMLAQSRGLAGDGLRFVQQNIETFDLEAGAYDLIVSNAALHWVEDHPALFARLFTGLRAGGQLAVQVPANHDQPPDRVAAELAGESPFVETLAGYAGHKNILPPEAYAHLLYNQGFVKQQVRLQVYAHELPSLLSVVEWVKGTTLTAYETRLGPELFVEFLRAYEERLGSLMGDRRPLLFPFKRILMWGVLP